MNQRFGPYETLDRIGSGGMATVYRARDTRNGSIVALKVMHPHLAEDPAYVERFRREASKGKSLDHPNIVRVVDFGEDGGVPYLVMEYVSGVTLERLIQERGALPIPVALCITTQICQALAQAHQAGLIHRDIKPLNIMIDSQGAAKLMDFGVAKSFDLKSMTRTGFLMGTPHYMSPEQSQGRDLDIRSDLYSLGITLYQMLTGIVPFNAETPWDVLRQHIEAEPVFVTRLRAGVPEAISLLVARSLAKKPEDRFENPQQMLEALQQFTIAEQEEVAALVKSVTPPPTRTPPATAAAQPSEQSKAKRSRPPWEWIAPGLAAVAMIGFFIYQQSASPAAPPGPVSRPEVTPASSTASPALPTNTAVPVASPTPTDCKKAEGMWPNVDAAWQSGDWATAVKLLDIIGSLCSADPQVAEKSYVARLNYGQQLMSAGKFTEAKEQCQNALGSNPQGADAKSCVDTANRAMATATRAAQPTSTTRPTQTIVPTSTPKPAAPLPSMPSNPRATAVNSTQIRLDWNDNSNNESGFQIYEGGSVIATVGANTTSYTVGGLAPTSNHCYSIRSYNSSGNSEAISYACATTAQAGQPPAAPSNLRATAISSTQVRLDWNDNSNNETNFQIYDGSFFVATVGANTTSYTVGGLAANSYHCYHIYATNSFGDSSWTDWACLTTPEQGRPPAAPTNLRITGTGNNFFNLDWNDNSNNESGFHIYDGSFFVATVGANTRNYTVSGLARNSYHCYHIYAYNSYGDSSWTDWACGTTY